MAKNIIISTFLMLISSLAIANDAVTIKTKSRITNTAPASDIDSVYFNNTNDSLFVQAKEGRLYACRVSEVDEISHSDISKVLTVDFDGESVTIVNPYFLKGVSVEATGGHVTINNTNTEEELEFVFAGNTSNGSILYNGAYKTTLVLNGLTLTNPSGCAINIQCGKRVSLELKKSTVNYITDGAGEHKASIYCKGHLEIDKTGTLNVTGKAKHAISSKEYLQLKKSAGIINILGAESDGIHCGQYFLGNGFNVKIRNVKGDGIQAEKTDSDNEDGYDDGALVINGGNYDIAITGDDQDALKADSTLNISNSIDTPVINITTSGVEDHGIKSNGNMSITAGNISISSSGKGGKGIKTDGTLVIGDKTATDGPMLAVKTTGSRSSSSTTTDTGGSTEGGWGGGNRPGGNRPGGNPPGGSQQNSGSSAKAIKAEGTIEVWGGSLDVNTAADGAEGMESKSSIYIGGGTHYLKCYDDCINTSGTINFAGGTTVCYSFGNDAVDSNYGRSGAITVSGGNVFAYTSKGSPEEGLDCDNNSYITVTGGIAISAGGSQGGGGGWGGSSSSSIGSATQPYYLGSSPSSYSSSNYYTLYNTNGTPICTYRFEANVSNSLSLLSAHNLGKGSITVKSGTIAPTSWTENVNNVFFINPTVSTSSTVATVTAK